MYQRFFQFTYSAIRFLLCKTLTGFEIFLNVEKISPEDILIFLILVSQNFLQDISNTLETSCHLKLSSHRGRKRRKTVFTYQIVLTVFILCLFTQIEFYFIKFCLVQRISLNVNKFFLQKYLHWKFPVH